MRTAIMHPSGRWWLASIPAVACALTWSAVAPAQSNKVAAEALFEEGRRLVAEGKIDAACPKFESSESLDPSSATLLNLGYCYERAGRTASAWATYKEAASLASATGRNDHLATAQKRAAALAPTLAKVTIVVPSPLEGLEVRRDGGVVARGEWGVAIPVDPGTHAIEATAPHKKPWRTSLKVGAEAATSTVTVPPLEDAPEPEPSAVAATSSAAPAMTAAHDAELGGAPAAPPAADASRGNTQRIAGAVTAGAGVVGLAVSGIFALKAKSSYDDSLAFCPSDPNRCTAQGVSLRDDARASGNVATVMLGVGVAAVATGAVLWFTAPKASGREVAVGVTPTLGGVRLEGTW